MPALQIRDDVVYREVDGAIVALSLDSGEYSSLDDIGSDIWKLIAQHGDTDAVRQGLLATYDLDPATCEQELQSFVRMLLARGLIRVGEAE
ncbi:MAG: PqqD family peptide modification chaperone [Acidobacteriaceae bacterium]|jgi:hypothetical protein|nr:PqqD family peptide modification chaperone [Acidobacteriaceae bacterium]